MFLCNARWPWSEANSWNFHVARHRDWCTLIVDSFHCAHLPITLSRKKKPSFVCKFSVEWQPLAE
jgi:hypothetical protein